MILYKFYVKVGLKIAKSRLINFINMGLEEFKKGL